MRLLAGDIGTERLDAPVFGGDGAVDVAADERRQRRAAVERPVEGGRAAVERPPHMPDTPPHAEIAHPQLPERTVEIGEHQVEQQLRGPLAGGTDSPQAAHDEQSVQHHHLEASVQRVGHAVGPVERRLARLRHHGFVEPVDRLAEAGPGEQAGAEAHPDG